MQLAQISVRVFGGAEVGLADDFDQRYARAIEIDQDAIGLVDVLAGVFLQMDARPGGCGWTAVAASSAQISI